jgi:4-hydroxybenzoate polyprenyltransferase
MKRLLAYAQLVRLPNVFTALADIGLGVLACGTMARLWPAAGWLFLSSACLYCGGIVWNDVFDIEQDRLERPKRPLPSGRVTRAAAVRLGVALVAVGLACAYFAGTAPPAGADGEGLWTSAPPVAWAGLLSAAILLYDGWLKRTWAGPLAMGTCRFLNVLLGWTVAVAAGWGWQAGLHLAGVVGLYIVGVTWFARTEARTSRRPTLGGAAGVMLGALALALPLPLAAADGARAGPPSPLFLYFLVGFGFLVGTPVCLAISQPTPGRVQAAVKRAVLGLVVLDAVLATALVGTAGLVLLVLLPPAFLLGHWLYST